MGFIYKIENTRTGKVYIGSTSLVVTKRWALHRCSLNRASHRNRYLQQDWNMFGSGVFEFSVIQDVSNNEDLISCEMEWIKYFRNNMGCDWVYNIAIPNMVYTKERSRKISEALKKSWSNPARHIFNKMTISKHYEGFVSPDGEEYRDIFNLEQFCKEHDLFSSAMNRVYTGKAPHHKGWVKLGNTPPTWIPRTSKYSGFIDPFGKVYRNIKNMSQFCGEHGLDFRSMSSLHHGKLYSHRGWVRIGCDLSKAANRSSTFDFVGPDGQEYKNITNLREFCREHKLDWTCMSRVNTGKQSTHKGFHRLAQLIEAGAAKSELEKVIKEVR